MHWYKSQSAVRSLPTTLIQSILALAEACAPFHVVAFMESWVNSPCHPVSAHLNKTQAALRPKKWTTPGLETHRTETQLTIRQVAGKTNCASGFKANQSAYKSPPGPFPLSTARAASNCWSTGPSSLSPASRAACSAASMLRWRDLTWCNEKVIS